MMQAKGTQRQASNQGEPVPTTDDEIREKYLERAIREMNLLTHEIHECDACPRGSVMPVIGSGHPQADIMMLKYAPQPAEIEEGVAFYGRAGSALMKSFKRLSIDPLTVYGTLCVKCPVVDSEHAAPHCIARLLDEIAIVQPKIVVVMGQEALDVLNEIDVPLSQPVAFEPGKLQKLTPTIDALVVPDIDSSLDEEDAKRDFWASFRVLGDWHAALPPY
jgi:uracil-DNA glycosylase family 4